jgi:hypothetical protein
MPKTRRRELPTVNKELVDKKQGQWLENAGKIILSCSNCDRHLAQILITKPDVPLTTELIATCPYCDDKSVPRTVDGAFYIGHAEDASMKKWEIVEQSVEDDRIMHKVVIETDEI